MRQLITAAREQVAHTVDTGLAALYWMIGDRIRREILHEQRARYGDRIVAALGRQLAAEFGAGFGEKNLRRMMQFSAAFPDQRIVAALWRQLGWSHFRMLIPIADPLQRDFYAEMCRIERWSTRTLAERIRSLLYERTAISRKPEQTVRRELARLRDHDLCAGKRDETVGLLAPARSGIHISSYVTRLLPRAALERRLRQALRRARSRVAEPASDGHSRRRAPARVRAPLTA